MEEEKKQYFYFKINQKTLDTPVGTGGWGGRGGGRSAKREIIKLMDIDDVC